LNRKFNFDKKDASFLKERKLSTINYNLIGIKTKGVGKHDAPGGE